MRFFSPGVTMLQTINTHFRYCQTSFYLGSKSILGKPFPLWAWVLSVKIQIFLILRIPVSFLPTKNSDVTLEWMRLHQIELPNHFFRSLANGSNNGTFSNKKGSFVKSQFHFCLAKNGDTHSEANFWPCDGENSERISSGFSSHVVRE